LDTGKGVASETDFYSNTKRQRSAAFAGPTVGAVEDGILGDDLGGIMERGGGDVASDRWGKIQ
jgi:hypothetical protein